MTTLLLAIAVLATSADDPVKNELKKLDGVWTLVPREGDMNAQTITLHVSGDRFTVVLNEQNKVKLKATIHPGTNPKCIDFLFEENKTSLEGIYKIDGENLTICVGEANQKDRPTEFPEKSEPGKNVVRFKRQKP